MFSFSLWMRPGSGHVDRTGQLRKRRLEPPRFQAFGSWSLRRPLKVYQDGWLGRRMQDCKMYMTHLMCVSFGPIELLIITRQVARSILLFPRVL